jgi:hypothetical protein
MFAFQGVSNLPVLVPADNFSPSDGRINFSLAIDITAAAKQPPREVHLVRTKDLHLLSERLSLQDWEFIRAASQLKRAFIDNDADQAREAYGILMPLLEEMGLWADSPGSHEKADFYTTKLKPDGRMLWPMHHYQRLITEALREIRVIFWWPSPKYSTLAFLCPDWKSAVWLASYLDRFRICPCGKLFTPGKKTRMVACSPQHTNYYRLKRWRERNAKQEAIQ